MSGIARLGIAWGLCILLTACGGGDAEKPWDDTTDTDSTTDDTVVTSDILLGSGFGDDFLPGTLKIALISLSAGGITSVSASLADVNGNLYQEVQDISFGSDCTASGLATLDSPIATEGGIAISSYQAQGCSGTDTITAVTTVNEVTLTATGSLTVQPAILGSLLFVSADPPSIGIKGVGLAEVSTLTFKVLDTNGNAVANQLVNFELNTEVGGITLSSDSATSDVDGLVRVDVSSGTVSTVVRVTATLASNTMIKTQSDGLVISTGIADQNSMSVSAEVLNPEAWRIDGVTVPINVYIADHFNNPVPDGTAVSFTTEGGQIVASCTIQNGGCSVNWTSSNPRPIDGRVTILVHLQGEESFLDANGNGVFDAPDTHLTDLPEAFSDDNENQVFDYGAEEFLDFNNNKSYDAADGEYNGVLCCDAAAVAAAATAGEGICLNVTPATINCSDSKSIHVRGSLVLVMSGSTAYFTYTSVNPEGASPNILDLTGGAGTVNVWITDLHGQTMPAGTTIEIDSTNGDITSLKSFIVMNTNEVPDPISISLTPTENSKTGDAVGNLQITVTTPGGVISYSDVITIID
jgi:hypothetical protein